MKLKDIVPYCLDYSKNSYQAKYSWIINGLTYSINSFQSYSTADFFSNEYDKYSKFSHKDYDSFIILNHPEKGNLVLNLDNEIIIHDKFIMVHKTKLQTTDSENELFFKTNYFIANGHDCSSYFYNIALLNNDALGGMATNLRTVFKDLIDHRPVQPKPAELTLDEKLDDLVDEIMKDSRSMAIKKLKRMLNERLVS